MRLFFKLWEGRSEQIFSQPLCLNPVFSLWFVPRGDTSECAAPVRWVLPGAQHQCLYVLWPGRKTVLCLGRGQGEWGAPGKGQARSLQPGPSPPTLGFACPPGPALSFSLTLKGQAEPTMAESCCPHIRVKNRGQGA